MGLGALSTEDRQRIMRRVLIRLLTYRIGHVLPLQHGPGHVIILPVTSSHRAPVVYVTSPLRMR